MAGDRPVGAAAALRRVVRLVAVMAACGVSAALSGWLVGTTAVAVSGNRNAPWIIGRAAGLSAYLLMVLLVATGLVLSHPGRARLRRPCSVACSSSASSSSPWPG